MFEITGVYCIFIVPSGHQSDEEEQEVILVDESQWVDAANIEIQQGQNSFKQYLFIKLLEQTTEI